MDRRICAVGITPCPLFKKVRQVYGARFYWRPLLFQYGSYSGRILCANCFLYLCGRTNAGCWSGLLQVFTGRYQYRSNHRNDHSTFLCCFRGHERNYIYPSGTILCLDICLYGPGHFYFLSNDWQPHTTTRNGIYP